MNGKTTFWIDARNGAARAAADRINLDRDDWREAHQVDLDEVALALIEAGDIEATEDDLGSPEARERIRRQFRVIPSSVPGRNRVQIGGYF